MTGTRTIHDNDVLSRMQLFQNVDLDSIEGYLENCHYRSLSPGEVLLSPDEPNSHTYLLTSGRLLVRLSSPGNPPLVALEPGECVGEMSILEGRNPSAYVIASTNSTVLSIGDDVLWDLTRVSHAVASNLLHVLARRVRFANDLIADNKQALPPALPATDNDTVTGLYNRRWLETMFARALARCERSRQPAALMLVDIDRLREINEQYGQHTGDQVLHAVAEALTLCTRPGDLITRSGGDEFAALFPAHTIEAPRIVAGRLLQTLRDSVRAIGPRGESSAVTVSVGIAQTGTVHELETLLENGEAALARAKNRGGDNASD